VAIKGRFISLEGIDGAGKTTTVREVEKIALPEHNLITIEKKTLTFVDQIVSAQMTSLHRLLWREGPEDPFYRLGAAHWMHLMGAWFATLDHTLITPALASGRTVLIDSWIYKFMARLRTKSVPPEVVHGVFRHLRHPDTVVYLDVAPHRAAARKTILTKGESGNPRHGEPTEREFIRHQSEMRGLLEEYAHADGWIRLNIDDHTVESIAQQVLGAILHTRAPARR
jgi:dTMP kinase